MKAILLGVKTVSLVLYWFSGIALLATILLTVADVILRRFGHPVEFTYEIVIFLGSIIIGFSLPQTSIDKSHVVMDFFTKTLSPGWERRFRFVTRIIGIALFIVVGLNFIRIGNTLQRSGQVSAILEIPEYLFPYSLSVCCFMEVLVLFFYDCLQELKGVKV